jgi:NAD(P)-dependent dehydrogenase (short-subunit alcohol dehydrogenase family)
MLFKNKTILVTGGGKGIGKSTIDSLLNEGAYVYAIIKSKKDNESFKKSNNLKIYNGKVENEKLVKKIFLDAKKDKKIITGIVNNAGVRLRKDFNKISKKELSHIFNINFFSIFRIMQLFSEYLNLTKNKGSIVNVASIVGQVGFKQLTAYASTKGALISLTKSFASEMALHGIRANIVSPGFTKTSYYEKFKRNKKLYQWTLSRIPLKRWGESNEIANMIIFLLSDKSNYITGENVNIDGGWLGS